MKLRFYLTAFCMLFIFNTYYAQQFKIVYLADEKYARDDQWLTKIQGTWHATGVNLRIHRSTWIMYPNEYWNEIKLALNAIKDKTLDVYIRLSMNLVEENWESNPIYDTTNDFHRRFDGSYYYNYHSPVPSSPRPVLNLTAHSKEILFLFINDVLSKLTNWQLERRALGENADIELIVPAISPDDETALPSAGLTGPNGTVHWELTGYTEQERSDFIFNYLPSVKYPGKGGFEQLKLKWIAPELSSWEDIQPRNYNWEEIWGPYIYQNGRKDFIDFRTEQLRLFFDQCYNVFNTYGFKFGLQFGSIYDGGIEKQGFYDPTLLVKNADYVINDDIPEYSLQFSFAGDYLRSLCKYWDRINNKGYNRIYGTETNWPEYAGFSDNNLMYYWGYQLDKYYDKGAMILFISHWGTDDKTLDSGYTVAQAVINGTLETRYSIWRNKLSSKRNLPRATGLDNFPLIHLSTEQVINTRPPSEPPYYDGHYHNQTNPNGVPVVDGVSWKHFPLYYFTKPRNSYLNSYNVFYNENSDIITNQMISNYPTYISAFYPSKTFYFNETSYYMPQDAYDILKTLDQSGYSIDNETRVSQNNWKFIPGTKDELNQIRNNIHTWSYQIPQKISIQNEEHIFEYNLSQNFPNPFNPSTIISYSIPSENFVTLKVYNILGTEVASLVNEKKSPGKYQVEFRSNGLSSGVYFYRISSGTFTNTKQFILIK